MGNLRVLLRSVAQRIYTKDFSGVTSYYSNGFESRVKSAEWQILRADKSEILEIGCGRDLHTSLVAAIKFGKKVIAYDVKKLADMELINFTAKKLGCDINFRSTGDLAKIGINYIVKDSIGTIIGFNNVVSTAVLEHVPEMELNNIFSHCENLNISTITANIDFFDHWSYIESVSPIHFYYTSELYWKIVNNQRMYQNRLRFCDINDIANQFGYQVSELDSSTFTDEICLGKLNKNFARYSIDELKISQVMVCWRLCKK